MILEQIQNDLKGAMKAGEEIRVSTLRFLLAQIKNREIDLVASAKTLTDEEVVAVIQKQAKERRESIEVYRTAERDDLARKEQAELDVLSKYLPQQLTEEELGKIVNEVVKEVGASGPADFGKVMGVVMGKVKGKVDGTQVAELVKKHLS